MKKKTYEKPIVETVIFECADVLTTSVGGSNNNNHGSTDNPGDGDWENNGWIDF